MLDESDNHIRIVILDPYILIRSGLRSIIDSEPGMRVVGEAGDSAMGLEMVARQKPDIVLLKLNDSRNPGLDVIPRLLETSSRTRIILLVTTENSQICLQAVQNGVLGIVSKAQPLQVLIKAIRKVHEGEVWIDHLTMANFVNTIAGARRLSDIDPDIARIKQLTERERQVIQLISLGLKNKQIAAQLCISETTVRHHLTSIYGKLGVSDRLELLVFANRCGMTKQQGDQSNSTNVPLSWLECAIR